MGTTRAAHAAGRAGAPMRHPLPSPRRRRQPPLAIRRAPDTRLIECLAIPQLAGYLPMALVERFAVVGVQAQSHLRAVAGRHLAEPVRIGEGLAREADDVGLLP